MCKKQQECMNKAVIFGSNNLINVSFTCFFIPAPPFRLTYTAKPSLIFPKGEREIRFQSG